MNQEALAMLIFRNLYHSAMELWKLSHYKLVNGMSIELVIKNDVQNYTSDQDTFKNLDEKEKESHSNGMIASFGPE